jgi:tetratricopeptide (TPR) repeat protein
MAIAKRSRAAAKRHRPTGSARAGEAPEVPAPAAVAAVVDAAAGGQHPRAIDLATAALAAPEVPVAERLTLLALRGESRIALGNLDAAREDADAMLALAKQARAKEGAARALCLRAAVRIRAGDYEEAVHAATAAWKDAKRMALPRLEALALLLLAEAESRQGAQDETCIEHALAARTHYEALGDASGAGRAMWVVAMARSHQGRAKDADAAAHEALALCKSAGDPLGVGNALNMLNFNEGDLGKAFRNAAQALAAFEACGHVERQAMMTINAAIGYAQLGLVPRALRMARKGTSCTRGPARGRRSPGTRGGSPTRRSRSGAWTGPAPTLPTASPARPTRSSRPTPPCRSRRSWPASRARRAASTRA